MSLLNFISRPFQVWCNSRGRSKAGRNLLRKYTFSQFLKAAESNTFVVCFCKFWDILQYITRVFLWPCNYAMWSADLSSDCGRIHIYHGKPANKDEFQVTRRNRLLKQVCGAVLVAAGLTGLTEYLWLPGQAVKIQAGQPRAPDITLGPVFRQLNFMLDSAQCLCLLPEFPLS